MSSYKKRRVGGKTVSNDENHLNETTNENEIDDVSERLVPMPIASVREFNIGRIRNQFSGLGADKDGSTAVEPSDGAWSDTHRHARNSPIQNDPLEEQSVPVKTGLIFSKRTDNDNTAGADNRHVTNSQLIALSGLSSLIRKPPARVRDSTSTEQYDGNNNGAGQCDTAITRSLASKNTIHTKHRLTENMGRHDDMVAFVGNKKRKLNNHVDNPESEGMAHGNSNAFFNQQNFVDDHSSELVYDDDQVPNIFNGSKVTDKSSSSKSSYYPSSPPPSVEADDDQESWGMDCVACYFNDFDTAGKYFAHFQALDCYYRDEYASGKKDAVLCQELAAAYEYKIRRPAMEQNIVLPPMSAAKWFEHIHKHIIEPGPWLVRSIQWCKDIQEVIVNNVILVDPMTGERRLDEMALKKFFETTNMITSLYKSNTSKMLFYNPNRPNLIEKKGQFINNRMYFKNDS